MSYTYSLFFYSKKKSAFIKNPNLAGHLSFYQGSLNFLFVKNIYNFTYIFIYSFSNIGFILWFPLLYLHTPETNLLYCMTTENKIQI